MPVAVLTFDFKELEEATENFSDDRLLGGGGFAKVYHGTLSTGEDRDVAVKRWNDGSRAESRRRLARRSPRRSGPRLARAP